MENLALVKALSMFKLDMTIGDLIDSIRDGDIDLEEMVESFEEDEVLGSM